MTSNAVVAKATIGGRRTKHELSDFSTDKRVLVLSLVGLGIGAVSAVVAAALVWLIALITNLTFYHRLSTNPAATPVGHHLGYFVVLAPMMGAMIIGLMARYGSPKIRGHGIPEALEAILLGRSRIEPKVALLKPISSAISIGTGGPFGAEGPIIMTGGALGSLIAQFFHLSASERKPLLVAGAAAGRAAIFSAPVAAVLFAVELLLFEWKPRSFIPVACAAAVAGALRVPLLGAGPDFAVAPHGALAAATLAECAGVGLGGGLAATLLTNLLYGVEDWFARLPMHWMWWPALAGIAVGLGGLVAPQALGVGYDVIRSLVTGRLVGALLIGLLVVKALIWAIALASGSSGGVPAPPLVMGGSMGALGAYALHRPDPGLWAMVGMAALMGGTMQVPLTAVVFVLELTGDVTALPGLLVGSIAAAGVTVLLMRRSI